MSPSIPAAVWLDANQLALSRAIAQRAGLAIVALGGPAAERGRATSAGLGAERTLDDLRSTLADAGGGLAVACVLVLSRQGIGSDDLTALATAHTRRVVVAGIEPVPGRLEELTSGAWQGRPGLPRAIERGAALGRFRAGTAMRNAREMLAAFGAIRSAWVRCQATPCDGSLGARLVDGLDLLQDLLGEPEGVVAAATHLHAAQGADLTTLSGELCITLTYPDGAVASVLATDRSHAWRRDLTLLGEAGVVRMNDDSFAWNHADGSLRDEWRSPDPRPPDLFESASAEELARSLTRLLNPHAGNEPPGDFEGVLATAHAALLSARTRSVESPGTIRRMMGE